jgi:hypothetical protein
VLTSLNDDGAHIRSVISTNANPTYSFKGDTNTGMFNPSADAIGFSTGGATRLTINNNGSLGIGSTSLTGITLRLGKTITGSVSSYGLLSGGTIQSDVTNIAILVGTDLNTVASLGISNIYHYNTGVTTIGAGTTIATQYGYVASGLTQATTNYGFFGNLSAATGRWNLYMNGTANNFMAGSLGIGSTSLTEFSLKITKSITGAVTSYGVSQEGAVQSGVTSSAFGFRNLANTQAAAFTLTNYYHYSASQNALGAGSAITNQYGFAVGGSLNAATNNYGFWGGIASGTNRWNLYMAGTAANYMAGNLGIGATPSPWGSNFNTIDLGSYFGLVSTTDSSRILSNAYINNVGNPIYKNTAAATMNGSWGAEYRWYQAASGTAGATITWSQQMTLNASGSLGIGATTINASAKVQVDSTTQGFLPPRMSTTQKLAIGTPAAGLMVYDTTLNQMSYYNGTIWINF